METPRANPDELLRAIQSEDEKEQTGNLKIFFGYAAGVGKTSAMLKAAQSARQHGIDVVHAKGVHLLEGPLLLEGVDDVRDIDLSQGGQGEDDRFIQVLRDF